MSHTKEPPPMKLYVTYGSPYARLARMVVVEKGLVGRVEILEAKTRTAGSPYYQINPSGRVPYLVDDAGIGMEDSQLICAYLDSLDGKPRFHRPLRESDWAYRRLEANARSMCEGICVWVRRAVARADLDPTRGGERFRHVGLGGAHRLGQTESLGQAGGDRRRERAAGAMGILRRDAVGGKAHECARLDQEIDALGAAPMPAFDQHRPRPQREQPLALLAHLALVAGDRRIEQRRGLRQVRREDERARDERALERFDCVGGKKLVAGGCDHDRIEHDFVLPPALEPGRDRFDDDALGDHPDLDRADIEIGKNRVHLRGDELRRHVVDRAHALGVLRRERGDDRGAVDAERRERLEISLDAGATARIRAGDGERDRRHHRLRCASARSTTPRRSRAAARGSSLRASAEITATPSAPAAIASPALLASMPAMAQSGH